MFRQLGKAFSGVIDGGRRILGKVSDTWARARTIGKNAHDHFKSKHPSLYKLGLEAVLNSPYGSNLEQAGKIFREIDKLADGDHRKKVEAIKGLGSLALGRPVNLADELQSAAEGAGRMIQARTGREVPGALMNLVSRGIGRVREREENIDGQNRVLGPDPSLFM